MKDLSKIDEKELVAELHRRKKITRASAWKKLAKVQSELLAILSEHQLSDMKWGSATCTISEEVEDFFYSLKEACGGNDIYQILGVTEDD